MNSFSKLKITLTDDFLGVLDCCVGMIFDMLFPSLAAFVIGLVQAVTENISNACHEYIVWEVAMIEQYQIRLFLKCAAPEMGKVSPAPTTVRAALHVDECRSADITLSGWLCRPDGP